MFQIGFGLVSDNSEPSWWMNILRTVFSTVDTIVYSLISFIYQVLFNIADSTIISSSVIKEFYGRIQLILGVIMIFKLSISMIQVVINPDLLTDSKKGMNKIISRIIIMLALFAAIMPLNIPSNQAPEHSYNAYLNDNGLLFGTLYSLQYRILSTNTLEKFVFGNTQMANGNTKVDKEKSGERMAAYILRGFIRPNLKEDSNEKGLADIENYVCDPDDEISDESGHIISTVATVGGVIIGAKAGAAVGASVGSVVPGLGTVIGGAIGGLVGAGTGWVINTVSGFFNDAKIAGVYTIYSSADATASNILDLINTQCDDGYALTYFPIISTACGIFILLALIGSCIDVAIRAFKLAILRLIAPIPIISYIDPKSSENGAFANWVKMLVSTYIDLFVRLLIIFFVLFIAESIMNGGLDLPLGYEDGIVGIISTIFIIVGLFYFIKQAPKFIKDALGLKGIMSNVGISGIMAAAGAVRAGGNGLDALRSAQNTMDTQVAAFNQGKQGPGLGQSFTGATDYMAQELTGDKNMTYRQMKRGERYLDREGLTAGRVEKEKDKMYKLQDQAVEAKNKYDRFVRGEMTDTENDEITKNYGHYDDAQQKFVMNDEERRNAMEGLQKAYLNAESDAGRQKAKYEDMQNEMNKRGGSRNSYRAKHGDLRNPHPGERDTRFSDLLTHEGREAMRTGSVRETLRNVTSIPQNERLARSDQRNDKLGKAISQDQDITAQTNQRMNDSRQNRNNP